jgi:2'-5' RNA ligase
MMSSLYFVAIIPPDDICEQITAIKHDFKKRFNSKHALRLIPHITLKAPFSSADHQQVLDWFANIPIHTTPFEQRLNNFNCFANKRNPVIFIEPVLGEPLKELQKNIIQNFKRTFSSIPVSQNELKFHPHMTVGYRDLSHDNFQLAWSEYKHKTFSASFMVDNFCLLQHDRKQWDIIAKHPLV